MIHSLTSLLTAAMRQTSDRRYGGALDGPDCADEGVSVKARIDPSVEEAIMRASSPSIREEQHILVMFLSAAENSCAISVMFKDAAGRMGSEDDRPRGSMLLLSSAKESDSTHTDGGPDEAAPDNITHVRSP